MTKKFVMPENGFMRNLLKKAVSESADVVISHAQTISITMLDILGYKFEDKAHQAIDRWADLCTFGVIEVKKENKDPLRFVDPKPKFEIPRESSFLSDKDKEFISDCLIHSEDHPIDVVKYCSDTLHKSKKCVQEFVDKYNDFSAMAAKIKKDAKEETPVEKVKVKNKKNPDSKPIIKEVTFNGKKYPYVDLVRPNGKPFNHKPRVYSEEQEAYAMHLIFNEGKGPKEVGEEVGMPAPSVSQKKKKYIEAGVYS